MKSPTLSVLRRDQINDTLWNRCIESSSGQVVYGFSWYLDQVAGTWEAIVAIGSDGSYQLACPLPVRIKMGFRILYQPHFCQYLGVFSTIDYPPQLFSQILATLLHTFHYISGYSFNPENTATLSQLNSADLPFITTEICCTHQLSLEQSYAQIAEGYHPDRKRNLRKAEKANWKLLNSASPDELIRLFKQNHEHRITHGVALKSYLTLKRLTALLQQHHALRLCYATQNGDVKAGVLIAMSSKKAVYLFNAASEDLRTWNGRTWLLDMFFKQQAATGLTFDFESPAVASISSYYTSFGALSTDYVHIRANRLPLPVKLVQLLRRRLLSFILPD